MNTQIFHSIKYDLKGHGWSHKALLDTLFLAHSFINRFFDDLFTFSDLITTLTYVLMDDFCPCFRNNQIYNKP